MLGKGSGRHLHALAHNYDPRPVQRGKRRGSIGSQRAIGWGTHTWADIDATAVALVDRVTRRMRTADRVGRTVVLRLRFEDFSRVTRSRTLPRATQHTETVLAAVRRLLHDARPLIEARGATLVGIAVANLDDAHAVQLTLPFDAHADDVLDTVLDELHDRFGAGTVSRAVQLGRRQGWSVPMLPD
jgi:DNA polymerase-4